MPKTPMFMEFERGSKIRDTVIKEDKLLEDILRTLGFKPGKYSVFKSSKIRQDCFIKLQQKKSLTGFLKKLSQMMKTILPVQLLTYPILICWKNISFYP